MEDSRVSQITATFKKYLGRNPLSQELKAYLSAKGDINTMVCNTSEYKLIVKQRLDQVFRTLLDKCADDDACDSFLTYCEKGGYFAHTCPKITIQEFVSSTPEYISKYSSIVDEVYTIETGQVPDDVTRTSMVKRFSDEKFGPNDLAFLIKTIKFTEKPPVSKISTYSINIISDESSDLIKESENLKKTWISLPEIKFIRNWQETTGTRIDIYEFLRYYNELGGSFSSIEHITHVKKQQQDAFVVASNIYKEYIDVDLSYEQFYAEHMIEYDRPEFSDMLIFSLVQGFEYNHRMRDTISRIYKNAFDEDIHEQDLDYYFGIAKSNILPIHGDEISKLVFSLGEELKMITTSVTKIYEVVLKRCPDMVEIRNNVSNYRAMTIKDAEKLISDNLYSDIEFQEVFKAEVVKKIDSTRNSEIFRYMRNILSECQGDMKLAISKVETIRKK
jgi:hypothetical protein